MDKKSESRLRELQRKQADSEKKNTAVAIEEDELRELHDLKVEKEKEIRKEAQDGVTVINAGPQHLVQDPTVMGVGDIVVELVRIPAGDVNHDQQDRQKALVGELNRRLPAGSKRSK